MKLTPTEKLVYAIAKMWGRKLNLKTIQALVYLAQIYSIDAKRKPTLYRWVKRKEGPWSPTVEKAWWSLIEKRILIRSGNQQKPPRRPRGGRRRKDFARARRKEGKG